MPKSHIEFIESSEYDASYADRLHTAELNDDTFYTFMGRVHGLAAQAVRTVVKLEYTDMVERSSDMKALTQMVVMDADFRPTDRFDSHVTHGIWTPQSYNKFMIHRSIFRSPVVKGYFVPNEDFVDFSMLEATDDESINVPIDAPHELLDA